MSKKKSNKRTYVRYVLFLTAYCLIFLQFSALLLQNKDKFFAPGYEKGYENLRSAYYSSQYAKKNSPGIIPDETFEAFAAGAFLKGMNPIHIVHDHPPLGRYILSLSIIIFDNSQTLIILFLLLSFLGIYLIAHLVTKNIFVSLLPVAIFANEPLTLNKLLYAPLPEPVQLPFILFAFYFFMRALGSDKKTFYFAMTSILLGFVVSIRFFVTGALMITVMFSFLVLFRRRMEDVIRFLITLPLAALVLFASYTRTIIDGYSLIQILGVQKYILAYHKSAFTNAFSFWDLILFNRWHTWWGDNAIISDQQWRIYWPISVVSWITLSLLAILKKVKLTSDEIVMGLWIAAYSLMLSTGYTSTRYFLPLLPFLYILLISGLYRLFKYAKNNKNNKT